MSSYTFGFYASGQSAHPDKLMDGISYRYCNMWRWGLSIHVTYLWSKVSCENLERGKEKSWVMLRL